jgi:hypothetical protein
MIRVDVPTVCGESPIKWTLASQEKTDAPDGLYIVTCIVEAKEYDRMFLFLTRTQADPILAPNIFFLTEDERGFVAKNVRRLRDITHSFDPSYPAAISLGGFIGHIDKEKFCTIELVCSLFSETRVARTIGGIWPV